jgi:hypothetical protein
MLWGFFDESGWHAPRDKGGGLLKLTVGGCLASFDSWECLSMAWASALEAIGIRCFHMKDFEARKSPYAGWGRKQREDRLNRLLEIIGAKDRHCYSFTNYWREDDKTSSIYERCAHDMLVELSMYDETFSLVFAHHPEFGRHSQLLDVLKKHGFGTTISSLSVATPTNTCPLQVADLIAYETSREERQTHRPRYPLERLQQLGCTFRLGSAVE